MKRTLFFLSILCGIFLIKAHAAAAATLSVVMNRNTVAIGDTFTAELLVVSEDVGINAVQGTFTYPKDLVDVVSIDSDDSILDFWLQKPPASDKTGAFSFIGGSANAFKGKALLIWRATFRVKGSGPIDLRLVDTAVTAGDGSGTNVLTEVRGAFLASLPEAGIWAPLPEPSPTSTQPVTPPALIPLPPVQIVRTPAPASVLPLPPEVQVSLYPNPDAWYNARENFLVHWKLPPDISAVATAYTHDPGTTPAKSKGLFDDEIFPAPENGISYVHVRFKNSVGWGTVTHYRVAVDTAPPAPFDVSIEEGPTTDNPTPAITYRASDPISRIQEYIVKVDAQEPIRTTEERLVLPVQLPGKHVIRVEAVDEGGNSTEADTEVTILPLPPPILTDIGNELYIGEGRMNVTGGGMPSSTVILTLRNEMGQGIETLDAPTDDQGNWHATFDRPLAKGTYAIQAYAKDARGATSLVVQSHDVHVRERPFLVLLGREITQMAFFLTIILILLVGFAIGWIVRSVQKKKRAWKAIISQRDIVSAMDGIATDMEEILRKYKKDKLGERQAFEAKRLLVRILKRTKSTKGYLLRGIDDLNT